MKFSKNYVNVLQSLIRAANVIRLLLTAGRHSLKLATRELIMTRISTINTHVFM